LGGTDEALYRLRIGRYRVIFKKEEKSLVILIVRIGHRKDIYSQEK
jgi:mRNA interferase RelE/StbE